LKPKPKNPTRIYLASSLLPLKKSLEGLAPSDMELELHFLSSSLIAQHVTNGASCDAVILADREWQEYLQKKQAGRFFSNRVLATNTLVLASLKSANDQENFSQVITKLEGPRQLIIADPSFVPLGRYSEQALRFFRLWDRVQGKLLTAQSAHDARIMLEKNIAPFAILFQSEITPRGLIKRVAKIPSSAHKPVNYIFLACDHSAEAKALERMLFSREFKNELLKYNFGLPHEP